MISKGTHALWRALLVLAGLAVLAVGGTAVAATGTDPGPGGVATTTSPSGAATVTVRKGTAGSYLADGQGRSLYLFAPDTAGQSTCVGACAQIWPPLTTTGKPQAGPGVTASMLGTTARSDGTTQVTYNKHPLYYFASDTAPGDTNGQGLNNLGGLWWLVNPAGSPIMSSGTPTTGSTPAPTSAPGVTPAPAPPGSAGSARRLLSQGHYSQQAPGSHGACCSLSATASQAVVRTSSCSGVSASTNHSRTWATCLGAAASMTARPRSVITMSE